jgi:hypothetical protein
MAASAWTSKQASQQWATDIHCDDILVHQIEFDAECNPEVILAILVSKCIWATTLHLLEIWCTYTDWSTSITADVFGQKPTCLCRAMPAMALLLSC